MYRKLTKDIDVSTMQEMRDRNMTNKQIADALGTTTVTVRRYIGPQPAGLRAEYGSYVTGDIWKTRNPRPENKSDVAEPECVEQRKVEVPVLRLMSTRSTLKGDFNEYIIDTSCGTVEMSGLVSGILDNATIDKFMSELKEIISIFKNIEEQKGVA